MPRCTMGKHSMMRSIKSICATPTDARAIIKSWKKSDAGYSEMAASLGWCAHNCVGHHISPDRALYSCSEMARRSEIAACHNSGNPPQGFEHAHLLYFKLQRPNACEYRVNELFEEFLRFLLQRLQFSPSLLAFP